MNHDSKAWDWGKGFCSKHLGQDLPCQVCINTLDKDLIRSDIIEDIKKALEKGDFAIEKQITKTESQIILDWWTNRHPISLKLESRKVITRKPTEQEIYVHQQMMSYEVMRTGCQLGIEPIWTPYPYKKADVIAAIKKQGAQS